MLNLAKSNLNLLKFFNKSKNKKILIISGKKSFPREVLREVLNRNNIYIYLKKIKIQSLKNSKY